MRKLILVAEFFEGNSNNKRRAGDVELDDNNNIVSINIFQQNWRGLERVSGNAKITAFDSDTYKDYKKLPFKTLGEFRSYFNN